MHSTASHRTGDEFLDAMVDDIQEVLTSRINVSPAYCVMADESCDVANKKHLVMCTFMLTQRQVKLVLIISRK